MENFNSPTELAGAALVGSIHGGQQPITGSRIYLYAVSTAGYGKAATSLLTKGDGSDTNGTYVLSNTSGGFSISGDYTCTPSTDVYILALGGKSSSTSATNSAIALTAALGKCPVAANFAAATPYINITEITTVASVYALAGFMTTPTAASTSGTALAQTGLDNAFQTAANLSNIATGAVNATIGSNGTIPVARIDTLADVIAACVNTDGTGNACSTLFNNSQSGSSVPSDTVTALLNIAHNPGANVSALYNLVTPQSPFQPTLTSAPNDLALSVQYTTPNLNSPLNLRSDASGNLWFRDGGSSSNLVEKLGPSGAVLSGPGYAVGGQGGGDSLTLDAQGNVFLGDRSAFSVFKLGPNGTLLSPANGFPAFCSNPNANVDAVAMDGSGNVWASGSGGCALKETSTGTVLSGASGFPSTSDDSLSLAIDSTGAAWITGVTNSVVRRVSKSGTILADYGSTVFTPYSIAIDAADTAWIANHSQGDITHLLPSGAFTVLFGGGLYNPNELSIDGANTVWVANNSTQISAFTNGGTAITSSNGYTASTGGVVRSLAIDGSGNLWTAINGPDLIVEFIGLATPSARPILPGQLGVRP